MEYDVGKMLIGNHLSVAIFYASQKGTSEGIAEDLQEECRSHDINAELYCISRLAKNPELLLKQDIGIFIAATTGRLYFKILFIEVM